MKRYKNVFRLEWLAVVALGFVIAVLLQSSCRYPDSPANGNSPPETRIANVPPNDTVAQYINQGVTPEFLLSWVGDDADGYVIAFKFKWTDIYRSAQTQTRATTVLNIANIGGSPLENFILVKGTPQSLPNLYKFFSTLTGVDTSIIRILGDSLSTLHTFAVPYKTGIVPGDSISGGDTSMIRSPTLGQFIFDSPTDSNRHRFEVASIDNDGAEDLSPAVVNFWTLHSPEPIAFILASSPAIVDTFQLAIRNTSDIFRGLQFNFYAIDRSTDDVRFAWAVDDTVSASSWSAYSSDQFAFVSASSFKPIISGWHMFYIRAKNRWGVVSNIASARFKAGVPAFNEPNFVPRTLLINCDINGNGTLGKPDSNQIKSYYSEVMDAIGKAGKYDIVTMATLSTAYPTQAELGKYSTIVYIQEQKLPALGSGRFAFSDIRIDLMVRYLRVGGKFIFIGPQDTIALGGRFQAFAFEFLHEDTSRAPSFGSGANWRQNNNLDFAGSIGQLGYPTLMIDPAKLPTDSLASFRYIRSFVPRGFGKSVGLFDSRTNDPRWENISVAVRFTNDAPYTYSTVHFGFPLYFCQKSAVIEAMRKAFADIGS